MVVKSYGLLTAAGFLCLFLGVVLVWLAAQLARGSKNSILAVAGLAPEQEVRIEAPGEVVLLLETPRLAADFRKFQIQVIDRQSGQGASMKYQFLTAQGASYGVTTMKVPFGRITTAQPGTFIVRVAGLEPGKDYSRYRLLLSRPYMGRMVLQIIGIVISGVGMLLSLIWGCWLLGLLQSPSSSAPQNTPMPATNVPGHTIDFETWKRQQESRQK